MKKILGYLHVILFLMLLISLSACDEVAMEQGLNDITVSPEIIEKIAEKRIYFGHQSVGYDILSGVSLLTENLKIQEVGEVLPETGAGLFHSPIGRNDDPLSKIDDFHAKMTGGFGDKVDTAFFKFCYVDFNQNTDVQAVFDAYRKTMEELESLYPQVTFVHFTVPLQTLRMDLKTKIKRMLGREISRDMRNIKRGEYNEMIRKSYSLVFDLAEIESTGADGSRNSHSFKGTVFYSLLPEYTTDGGHLNQLGSKLAARKLLIFLSNLE